MISKAVLSRSWLSVGSYRPMCHAQGGNLLRCPGPKQLPKPWAQDRTAGGWSTARSKL